MLGKLKVPQSNENMKSVSSVPKALDILTIMCSRLREASVEGNRLTQ